jgi:Protein of unknown function (DUF2778)
MYACIFELNNKSMSTFKIGGSSFPAFSGQGLHVNQRISTCHKKVGPIPLGIYYILDRQAGGLLGSFRDIYNDKREWFALYAIDGYIDDEMYCQQVKRGNFRLHPKGPYGLSEGCITIDDRTDFHRIAAMLRSSSTTVIPDVGLKAYGRVIVQ